MLSIAGVVWAKLHEPRLVTFWQMTNYVIVALIGLSLLVAPPAGPLRVTELLITLATCVPLTAAAVVGFWACSRGVWWVERVAILIIVVGLAAQVPLLWNLFATLEWHILLCLSVADAIVAMLRRHALISWAYLDPTR